MFSVYPRYHFYWMSRKSPEALVSGITELEINSIYSKEMSSLSSVNLGNNKMLLRAHGHNISRQIQFPDASIVTV